MCCFWTVKIKDYWRVVRGRMKFPEHHHPIHTHTHTLCFYVNDHKETEKNISIYSFSSTFSKVAVGKPQNSSGEQCGWMDKPFYKHVQRLRRSFREHRFCASFCCRLVCGSKQPRCCTETSASLINNCTNEKL